MDLVYLQTTKNLFLFDPPSIISNLVIAAVRKILRWAVRLSPYNYVCINIRGEENVWTSRLDRWTTPFTIRKLVQIPKLPSALLEWFDCPSVDEVFKLHEAHADSRPDTVVLSNELRRTLDEGVIWIPDNASNIQPRICIIAQTYAAGHLGIKPLTGVLRSTFNWTTLKKDVKLFCAKLHLSLIHHWWGPCVSFFWSCASRNHI